MEEPAGALGTSPTPRFVGRGAELAVLTSHLHRLTESSSGIVVVEGVPGVGTSRLLQEALRQAAEVPPGLPTPLRPLVLGWLARLPRSTVDLLRAAAVLGPRFEVTHLARFTGTPTVRLFPALEDARRAGVLDQVGRHLAIQPELVRDALYHDVAPAIRSALHLDACRVLAAAGAPALGQSPPTAVDLLQRALDGASTELRDALLGDLVVAQLWGRAGLPRPNGRPGNCWTGRTIPLSVMPCGSLRSRLRATRADTRTPPPKQRPATCPEQQADPKNNPAYNWHFVGSRGSIRYIDREPDVCAGRDAWKWKIDGQCGNCAQSSVFRCHDDRQAPALPRNRAPGDTSPNRVAG